MKYKLYDDGNGDSYGSHPNIPTASAPTPHTPGAGGGYSPPDYTSLIQSDPAYLAAMAQSHASQAAAEANRRAALRRAYIMYGGALPAGFKDRYGDLDKATLDAAGKNENSIIAQLTRGYQQSTEQFHRQLAARGALQSGDLNYGADQLQRGEEQQQYDAGNQFLDQANNYYGTYQDVLNQNAQSIIAAIEAAEGNVYNNPAYRPSADTASPPPSDGSSPAITYFRGQGNLPTSPSGYATYHASASAMSGRPVYQDDQGRLYDQHGNPFQV